jgi:GH15 family glucan-1,4-alpha-glucosidase
VPPATPSIGDYALVGNGITAALVSRHGSVDWLCLPRLDSGSCFARLLDAERGGACALSVPGKPEVRRGYRDGSGVLETTLATDAGELRLTDALLPPDPDAGLASSLLRVLEGVRGELEVELDVDPRFDYGQVRPWVRGAGDGAWTAVGGDDGLLVGGDVELERTGDHGLHGRLTLREGDRVRLWLGGVRPEDTDPDPPSVPDGEELDRRLEAAAQAARDWLADAGPGPVDPDGVLRSALTLRALTNPDTGAVGAAATTSLPEALGGERNWDYRFAWIRDSTFAVRSLAEIGLVDAADGFRRFVQRAAAGHADELQVLFGMGGERRLGEQELDLAGYRDSRPVRVGNGAAGQLQLDAYGELIGLFWRWHRRGHSPDDDDWRFVVSLADQAAELWSKPDAGLWEWRGDPQHFVHSKVLCWSALERSLGLARECGLSAPTERWAEARDEIREAVESEGFDADRGTYRQAFGSDELDAALLLLPLTGYLDWDDERMVGTTDAVRRELAAGGGLLYRYRVGDGLGGEEGAFLPCSFWLAEALAEQGRVDEAREVFDATLACANDVGLLSEEWDPERGEMLGNVPQSLTHFSHITAALALGAAGG